MRLSRTAGGIRWIFESILDRNGLRADEVLVVGDNADSEIEAGNRLGITTVQVLRPGVPRSSKAAHHIHGLVELGPISIDPAGPVRAGNVHRR